MCLSGTSLVHVCRHICEDRVFHTIWSLVCEVMVSAPMSPTSDTSDCLFSGVSLFSTSRISTLILIMSFLLALGFSALLVCSFLRWNTGYGFYKYSFYLIFALNSINSL